MLRVDHAVPQTDYQSMETQSFEVKQVWGPMFVLGRVGRFFRELSEAFPASHFAWRALDLPLVSRERRNGKEKMETTIMG